MSMEARMIAAIGVLCLVVGAAWIGGAIGLLIAGVILSGIGLFVIDVGGGADAESLDTHAPRIDRTRQHR